jgi:regulatory protein
MRIINVVKKRTKVTVFFDNDENLIFPYELFLKNTLFVDDELTVEQKKNLEEKIELYKIKQSSFVYLSGRNHSKYELKLKLLKKSYNKQLVSVVLSDLERLNYLDDKEFAKQYFEVKLKKKKGINLIKSELAKKGVRREIVEEVSLSFSNDPRLIESAKILSEKKLQVLNRKNQTELQKKQKMFQYLLSRGFSTEIVKESIEKLKLD